jgi:hypothetical protein
LAALIGIVFLAALFYVFLGWVISFFVESHLSEKRNYLVAGNSNSPACIYNRGTTLVCP